MSTKLADKIKSFKQKTDEMINNKIEELDEAEKLLESNGGDDEKEKVVHKKVEEKKKDLRSELRESGIEVTKGGEPLDFEIAFSLKESTFDNNTGEVLAVLIEAGTNPMKRRHYPNSTIQEASPAFRGLKMYINHQTADEEKERPERDLRDWVSTITESWYENGKAMAKIAVHDSWLRERLVDPVAREHIGLSINAGGKVAMGKVNGQDMQIVEQIVMARKNGPASVDWVTEAGARGRVARMLKESNTGEKSMELKEATFEDLKRENPQLVKDITENVKKDIQESSEFAKKQKEHDALLAENASLKKEKQLAAQNDKINAILKESKLPEIAIERVRESVSKEVFEDDVKLKESIAALIKRENDYLNKITEKGKIKMGDGTGATVSVKESIAERLDKRMGIQKEEENKDKK